MPERLHPPAFGRRFTASEILAKADRPIPDFDETIERLIAEGLVERAPDGSYALTTRGVAHCRREFGVAA